MRVVENCARTGRFRSKCRKDRRNAWSKAWRLAGILLVHIRGICPSRLQSPCIFSGYRLRRLESHHSSGTTPTHPPTHPHTHTPHRIAPHHTTPHSERHRTTPHQTHPSAHTQVCVCACVRARVRACVPAQMQRVCSQSLPGADWTLTCRAPLSLPEEVLRVISLGFVHKLLSKGPYNMSCAKHERICHCVPCSLFALLSGHPFFYFFLRACAWPSKRARALLEASRRLKHCLRGASPCARTHARTATRDTL